MPLSQGEGFLKSLPKPSQPEKGKRSAPPLSQGPLGRGSEPPLLGTSSVFLGLPLSKGLSEGLMLSWWASWRTGPISSRHTPTHVSAGGRTPLGRCSVAAQVPHPAHPSPPTPQLAQSPCPWLWPQQGTGQGVAHRCGERARVHMRRPPAPPCALPFPPASQAPPVQPHVLCLPPPEPVPPAQELCRGGQRPTGEPPHPRGADSRRGAALPSSRRALHPCPHPLTHRGAHRPWKALPAGAAAAWAEGLTERPGGTPPAGPHAHCCAGPSPLPATPAGTPAHPHARGSQTSGTRCRVRGLTAPPSGLSRSGPVHPLTTETAVPGHGGGLARHATSMFGGMCRKPRPPAWATLCSPSFPA